jgi:hypothetical protein
MEGIVMVDYGQAVTLIAKMFFLMTITVFLISVALVAIGIIVLAFVIVGKFLIVHIAAAAHKPKEIILAQKFLPLATERVK